MFRIELTPKAEEELRTLGRTPFATLLALSKATGFFHVRVVTSVEMSD